MFMKIRKKIIQKYMHAQNNSLKCKPKLKQAQFANLIVSLCRSYSYPCQMHVWNCAVGFFGYVITPPSSPWAKKLHGVMSWKPCVSCCLVKWILELNKSKFKFKIKGNESFTFLHLLSLLLKTLIKYQLMQLKRVF